jgi:DNA-binding GntR family transcriptional regulator
MADSMSSRSELRVVPLSRDTLQERAYRQISDLILDGQIAPGQSVTIQGLAQAFGVSTMPVREALKRLTAAGALTFLTGRSMGIPRLSIERLADLRRVRLNIEVLATQWAAQSIEANDLERLSMQCDRLDRAVAQENVKEYLRANRAFHFIVYNAARSPTLVNLIETLWLQISPYFNLLHGLGNYITANTRHQAILEALEARDGEAACEALRADIDDAYGVLCKMLT